MFGIIIGILCLWGLFAVLHGGHRRHRHWRGHYGHWGVRGGMNALFDRIGTSNSQGKTILAAANDLQDALSPIAERLRASRGELSKALRAEQFDAAGLEGSLSGHDADLIEARRRVVAFLGIVHETLDPTQRQQAARLLAGGFRSAWGHGHHPHRHAHAC